MKTRLTDNIANLIKYEDDDGRWLQVLFLRGGVTIMHNRSGSPIISLAQAEKIADKIKAWVKKAKAEV